jgi:4-amino-4-deoxy-L-arabinose transferase-like glycosyltransferase
MFTFVGAVVNSDALLILLYTALLALTVHVLARGWSARVAAGAGIAAGLGMLTKPLILAALPTLGLAVLWDAARRARWRSLPFEIALSGGLAAAICGPWLWRSQHLYGALLYANPISAGVMPVENPFTDYPLLRYGWHYLQSLAGGIFATYWADFGWIDTPLARPVYLLLLGLCAIAAAGLALYFARAWRSGEGSVRREAGMALALGGHVALLAAAIGYNTWRTWVADGIGWGGMQGRYYLGPAAGAMALLALGLLAWVPARWRPAGHLALRWGMIALNLVCLFGTVLPRYYL